MAGLKEETVRRMKELMERYVPCDCPDRNEYLYNTRGECYQVIAPIDPCCDKVVEYREQFAQILRDDLKEDREKHANE